MTAASSTGRFSNPTPALLRRWNRRRALWFSDKTREWTAKVGLAVTCLALGLATAARFGMVLAAAPAGLDVPRAALLFALICRAVFYLLVCWFAFVRCPAVKRASGWRPRAIALLGTFSVLGFGLLPPAPLLAAWHLVAATLFLLSAALAVAVLMRLGRSLSIMPEARRLVTSGPYRFVRHPLYLVEELAAVAGFIEAFSLAAALLFVAQVALQLYRIENEEAVLTTAFPDYSRYKASTARLLPGLW
ncbi:MAG TPA: isoprenylcysteine carboxylmethyltransferase family protein [Stellaceae bacterium]|jgi:protein-S-isoprenylcysteine O-methyltransferase Ste14